MKIDQARCVGCGLCVPYCPVGAIHVENRRAAICADACVECSCCRRSGVCKKGAIVQDELDWPRGVRSVMSDVFTVFEGTGVSGRGTEEMKTTMSPPLRPAGGVLWKWAVRWRAVPSARSNRRRWSWPPRGWWSLSPAIPSPP